MSGHPAVLYREQGSWRHAGCGGLLVVLGHWTNCPRCKVTMATRQVRELTAPDDQAAQR